VRRSGGHCAGSWAAEKSGKIGEWEKSFKKVLTTVLDESSLYLHSSTFNDGYGMNRRCISTRALLTTVLG